MIRFFFVSILLCASLCTAADFRQVVGYSRGVGGGSADCATGTYLANYNGDHSSGSSYICFNSGASSEDASSNTVDSVTTEYVEYNATGEHLSWDITGDITDLDGSGTLFVSVQTPDDSSGSTGENVIFEIWYDSNNYIVGRILSTGAISVVMKAKNTSSDTYTAACNNDTSWIRIGYSWSAGVGHDISCVPLGSGENWSNLDADTVQQWGGDPTTISIGQHNTTNNVTNKIRAKDYFITTGFKDEDPLY